MCAKHKSTDPNLTLEVNNDQLESLLVRYSGETSAESLNALLNLLTRSRVLVPANINDKKQPVPCLIKNKNGSTFMPLYTSKKQIPEAPKSPAILNMPYAAVNKIAVTSNVHIDGVAINPFSNNLVIKMELLQRIDEVDKQRAEAQKNRAKTGQAKEVKLSPQQYVVFERRQYEFRFLPKKLFEEGKAFIDELCREKETYIDALYEESYQQKRMYPYLPEDFSVLAIQISDQLQVIRVDMQARDLENGSCRRIFFVWDQEKETGRYFTIEKNGNENILGEVTSDWKHKNLGKAPEEGAELQGILDLIGYGA
jgi:hypothetical protein